MSVFLGSNNGALFASDERLFLPNFRWNWADRRSASPFLEGVLWSSSCFMGGAGALLGDDASETGVWGAFELDESGGAQIKKIIGTTRDGSGNPLGSCVVRGFVTATNVFVGQVTSDPAGYFELPTVFTGAHYLVCYQAGSPDLEGTSVNTLTPV